jgi:hypothetical protein
MWYIDFEAFLSKLNIIESIRTISNQCVSFQSSFNTSKNVRMPGHVVTTDALQRLCITHVHTRIHERLKERYSSV